MTDAVEVREGTVVKVAYTLRLKNGEPAELPGQPSPLEFTLGTKEVLPGLQSALLGMHPQEERTVTLSSEEAFGERNPSRRIKMRRSKFPERLDLYEGRRVPLRGPDGQREVFYVTAVRPDYVELDTNHPLSGEELTFVFTVLDVGTEPLPSSA